MKLVLIIVFVNICLANVKSARILGVYPSPSISHQVVFRSLTLELVKRGHEVVVITTDPVYKNKTSPENLIEIDISESYSQVLPLFKDLGKKMKRGVIMDSSILPDVNRKMLGLAYYMFQFKEVDDLIKNYNDKFDLVIAEVLSYSPLIFGKIFDAPVIIFSSLYGLATHYDTIGAAARHPILYPNMYRNTYRNGFFDKIKQLYDELMFWKCDQENEQIDNDFLKSRFGPDVPTVAELKKNIVMLFANSHPIFDGNRPVPPGTVFLGATHLQPTKELPQDLKSYIDSSSRGVVYVSLGSNVRPSLMDKELLDVFLDAFEKIPYDILWKFDSDDVDRIPKNVKIQKWFPQRDILGHPNIKVFVTQGGLQSTDEAIDAGVPLVGIPFMGDQWYNTNRYVQLGIGVAVDSLTITADDFSNAVNTVANNPIHKENLKKLKSIMRDQRETPLERAVWWTEHVLRHKNSRHLLGPAAQLSWPEYLMLDVLIPLAIGFILIVSIALFIIIYTIRLVLGTRKDVKVKKH